MALMAVLLAAVAAAMHASFTSYAENNDLAEVTQSARAVLTRLTGEVRTADSVTCTSTRVTAVYLNNPDVQQVEYELSDGTLWYRRTVGGNTTSYGLLGGQDRVQVSAFNVTAEAGLDSQQQACTKCVIVRLDLSVNNKPLPLTASADIRKNQTY